MLNRDAAEKQRRGYVETKSFVRNDGSEVLKGEDWRRRKRELWVRAGGRCEYFSVVPENRCTAEGVIPAHIEPRHPKRDDRISNLRLYCLAHDLLTEKKAWRKPRWREHAGKL